MGKLGIVARKNNPNPKPHRSKKKMSYHGREGYPIIHKTEAGKQYIMVRRRGGGTKRLYLVKGNVPKHLREKTRRKK
jgi:hypothetical protein